MSNLSFSPLAALHEDSFSMVTGDEIYVSPDCFQVHIHPDPDCESIEIESIHKNP